MPLNNLKEKNTTLGRLNCAHKHGNRLLLEPQTHFCLVGLATETRAEGEWSPQARALGAPRLAAWKETWVSLQSFALSPELSAALGRSLQCGQGRTPVCGDTPPAHELWEQAVPELHLPWAQDKVLWQASSPYQLGISILQPLVSPLSW